LVEGIKLARRVALESPAFKGKVKNVVYPKAEALLPYNSEEEIRTYVKKYTFTLYHPVGTCSMGRADDPNAVVDPQYASMVVSLGHQDDLDSCFVGSVSRASRASALSMLP